MWWIIWEVQILTCMWRFGQQNGINCEDTFTLVVKPTIIRMILIVVLSKLWCLHQLDIKSGIFMVILMKLSTCISHQGSIIHIILNMYAFIESHYINLNKHHVLCITGLLTMVLPLFSITPSLIIPYSYFMKVMI